MNGSGHATITQNQLKQAERTLKALANRRRLSILRYLQTHPRATVGELAEAIKLSFKSTSRHLSVLSGADLIEREQRSLNVHYALATPLDAATKAALSLLS